MVEWQVKSEIVHHSKASWVGAKPRDGGFSLLQEMFEWIRQNKTPGKMVVHFGIGGSVSCAEFEQTETTATPEVEDFLQTQTLPTE
jgi:hypothetical protein